MKKTHEINQLKNPPWHTLLQSRRPMQIAIFEYGLNPQKLPKMHPVGQLAWQYSNDTTLLMCGQMAFNNYHSLSLDPHRKSVHLFS